MLADYLKRVWAETGDKYLRSAPGGVDHFLDEVLGIGDYVWPSVRTDLKAIFENPVNEVVKVDGIGSGKSTLAAFCVSYMLYMLYHVRDPSLIFNLMPGGKLTIVIGSLRERQAKGIIFDDLTYRLRHSEWFREHYSHRSLGGGVELEFPNRVAVLAGSSSETVATGYNVIMAVIDEGDWFIKASHIGDALDQAENMYWSMFDRIETRFEEKGLMVLVSSPRNPDGFMMTRWDELQGNPHAYTTRRPYWRCKKGNWTPYFIIELPTLEEVDSDVKNGQRRAEKLTADAKIASLYEPGGELKEPHTYLEIPEKLRSSYSRNPRRFLRDRGSVLLTSSQAYILRPDTFVFDTERLNPIWEDGSIAPWVKPLSEDTLYYSHSDLGATRDKLAICIAHQESAKTVVDLVFVVDPKEEGKVDFERARRDVFYELLSRGFKFGLATFDKFQSYEMMMELAKRGIPTELFSVDRDKRAYDIWMQAHYDGLLDIYDVPGYMDEVKSLIDTGKKIDHSSRGSKDITDAVAGAVYHCRTRGKEDAAKVTTFRVRRRNRGRREAESRVHARH